MKVTEEQLRQLEKFEKSLPDILKNGKPAIKFMAITQEIQETAFEEHREWVLKQNRLWSLLGHQVIGAEVL